MNNSPLVTVFIPTYNRKDMLVRAIDSVLGQDYQNIEIYVVDNGSTDGTSELVSLYVQRNKNIKYHRFDENKGACFARNFAISRAAGILVTGLDDDDEFLPHRLSQLVASYDDKYSFVCTGFYWDYGHYRKTKIDSHKIIDLATLLNFNEASNQVLVSKAKIMSVGLFDESFTSCQDWDMWTRLIIKYGNALRVGGASYVVHTAHNKPRITGNIPNRLSGLRQFYTKHSIHMSAENKSCFEFHELYNAELKLGFFQSLKYYSLPIKNQAFRYFIASMFPKLAKKRLDKLRVK